MKINTERELKALRLLNADLYRPVKQLSRELPTRPKRVMAAVRGCSGRFDLCRSICKLVRAIHNSRENRMPESINRAMEMVTSNHSDSVTLRRAA